MSAKDNTVTVREATTTTFDAQVRAWARREGADRVEIPRDRNADGRIYFKRGIVHGKKLQQLPGIAVLSIDPVSGDWAVRVDVFAEDDER